MNKGLNDRVTITPRILLKDERGWFLKVINGNEDYLPPYTGEIYFTSASPGCSKGGHYHKKASEWFTLIKGSAILFLEDIFTKENMVIEMEDESPITVFVPKNVAHKITSKNNKDIILCAYTDQLYNPSDTINYKFTHDIL